MIINTAGLVRDDFYVSGLSVYPIELLDGKMPVLFDGGVTCAGCFYADAIRDVLGNRNPEILFITHAHWDHCGAVTYLKNVFPSMKIALSSKAAEILKKRNAVQEIERLNAVAKPIVTALPGVDPAKVIDDTFQSFKPDIELKDGQIFTLHEGATVQVLSTPGHTRDNMSFYIPEKKILIASESCGCLDGAGTVIVEFLADYDLYLSSLRRMADLSVEILCQGHRLVFVGKNEVQVFFDKSISATTAFREHVMNLLHEKGGSLEDVVLQIKAEQYDTNKGIKQPEVPYLINLRAQVKHLAGKLD